jgi:iron complex outermembrane receptor protein
MYDDPRYAEWRWSNRPRWNSGAMADYAAASGPLRYLVSASHTLDEGYRQNDLQRRWSLYSKAIYEISPYQSMTVVGNLLLRRRGNFIWWESLHAATRPDRSQLNNNVTSRRGNVSASYKEFVDNSFFYTVKGMYFGNFWNADSAGNVYTESTSDLFSIDAQGTYEAGRGNVWTFGTAANYDRVRSTIFGHHPGMGWALYAQNERSLTPTLRLTAGARYDIQKVSRLAAEGAVSPKLGVTYQASDKTTLRASYGSGFRYPSIGELFTTLTGGVASVVVLPSEYLKAEKSWTMEFGVAQTIGDRVFLDAAIFHNEFRDLIEAGISIKRVKLSPSDTAETDRAVIQFDNITRARIQGGELGIKVDWIKNMLNSEVGYTYTWPMDLSNRSVLRFRPRHIFYTSTSLMLGNLKLSSDFRFISRIEKIDDNLVRLVPIIHGDQRVPIYVTDVRVLYELPRLSFPLRVGLNVNNLFNYHYVELIGNLAPLRTFVLSIEGAL